MGVPKSLKHTAHYTRVAGRWFKWTLAGIVGGKMAAGDFTGADMTRARFVREIESGNYDNYHIRRVNGVKTPVSNPDNTTNNNLD